MTERIRGAIRVLLASSVVQCCEVAEEGLARWREGIVAALRKID